MRHDAQKQNAQSCQHGQASSALEFKRCRHYSVDWLHSGSLLWLDSSAKLLAKLNELLSCRKMCNSCCKTIHVSRLGCCKFRNSSWLPLLPHLPAACRGRLLQKTRHCGSLWKAYWSCAADLASMTAVDFCCQISGWLEAQWNAPQ